MPKITNRTNRAWKAERLPTRLQRCRAMLRIYGLLTEAESIRISQKIVQAVQAIRSAA
jgi:hypothetical protein